MPTLPFIITIDQEVLAAFAEEQSASIFAFGLTHERELKVEDVILTGPHGPISWDATFPMTITVPDPFDTDAESDERTVTQWLEPGACYVWETSSHPWTQHFAYNSFLRYPEEHQDTSDAEYDYWALECE